MTDGMHKIAAKTERETSSMHVITLVTLVFLPGTFVAVRFGLLSDFSEDLTADQTFLGSGLFQWEQDTLLDFPHWRPGFFALFAKICFPLMGATILIWLISYFWVSWRRHQRVAKDVEQQVQVNDSNVDPPTQAVVKADLIQDEKNENVFSVSALSSLFRRLKGIVKLQ